MTPRSGAPAPTDRKKDNPLTEINAAGAPDTGRYTDYMRYPLPPLNPREEVQFDGYGRYKLPSPTTGRPTSYTRATTLSSTTADHFGIGQWKIRSKVDAVLRAAQLAATANDSMSDNELAMAALYGTYQQAIRDGEGGGKINKIIDEIDDLAGAADARELGSFVHDWMGELDMGRVLFHQLPEMAKPYAESYLGALRRAGLVAVPEYVERVVLNDQGEETVAGRIDRIYRVVETGELYLGDLKTSKTLDLALMEYAMQFAVYGYATLMLNLDGLTWDEMPKINQDMCLVVHLPSDQPERSQVVPFDLFAGGEALITAMEVRRQRKEVPKKVLGQTTPIPSESTLRLVAARQALLNIKEPQDASRIFEQYEDIWTDDLTELGTTCIGLLNATTNEEN